MELIFQSQLRYNSCDLEQTNLPDPTSHLISGSNFIFLFLFFGLATWHAGSQFPDHGLNLGPWQ